ncbi:MAG: 2'-5' RNA ligase family protein, partial [Myxococcota bacterium]|nr:2'-5' RNA ligase family protein [Myxococcota bacterium]
MKLTRRRFLGAGAACAVAALPGCGPSESSAPPEPLVGDPLETLRVRGYRGLVELPWFELDARGRLVTTAELPPGVVFHAHLGFSFFLAPGIDYNAAGSAPHYSFDCDADAECVLDLDVYMNHFTTERMQSALTSELVRTFLIGSAAGRTHTIPNLLAEMDDNSVERAVLLPLAPGFPFRDNLAERWLDAVAHCDAPERLVVFGSVHPADDAAPAKLRALADRVEAAVVSLGFEPERRPFRPHVTLARVDRRASGGRRRAVAEAVERLPAPSPSPFTAHS